MLITHAKPAELWGKKVYDTDGRPVRLVPPAGTHVDGNAVTLRRLYVGRPWLRLVH